MAPDKLVMILEDEIGVSSLLVMIMEDQDWGVAGPFRTNRLALEYLDNARPDVALIDFNIADGNSASTAKRLCDLGIPFVVISGYPKSMARNDDLSSAEWLNKPFSEEQVVASLSQALKQSRPAA